MDGSVIVGTSNSDQAFRWTTKTGMRTLGTLTGTGKSSAMAVSADGSIIVGVSTNAEVQRAFRWSAATGVMTAIDMPANVTSSVANDVSLDGKVVVGEYYTETNMHAFRWTATDGAIDIGTLPGSYDARAFATNKDGTIVAGASRFINQVTIDALDDRMGSVDEDSDVKIITKRDPVRPLTMFFEEWHGFRWNAATGSLQPLEETPSGTGSLPYAMSADGSVIVGNWEAASGQRGFRWTEATGMVSVEDWLRSNGVSITGDFTSSATGVSADGNIIVGQTRNNTPYIARIVLADTGTSGPSTTLDDVDASASGDMGNGGRQPRGIDLTSGSGTSTPTPTSSGSSASSSSSSTSSTSSTSASPSGSSSASTSPATTTSSPAPAAGESPVAAAPAPSSAAPTVNDSPVASTPPPASAAPAA
ncbi:autotransporter domain-containing protein, partial [Agrobacterium sp. DKPNP3]